ncbi:PREDICTED: ammonium transporter Rh type A isoform X2 [Nicrophorus vespilloides]|uniref:Ammonium transporter Rh type A isoform X2 n=1 Tax=Nicrophorus vespilloides TaxID=110193 RepID=A0ABM1NC32_NICVS|nr:PREDICTED: ammonium transporter Rh type A isoform X2 [Nicrophorus vespilloides]
MAVGPALLADSKKRDVLTLLALEVILIVLAGIFGTYDHEFEHEIYPMFQDVHVMIFVGFGFLMTFMKRYGFSAVGFNFLVAALLVQWAILCNGFYHMDENYKIPISIVSLLKGDVAVATVLISMGAVLGRTSHMQLIFMGLLEIAFFSFNEYIAAKFFIVTDAGDSMFVHAFGAYFGLAVSFVLTRKQKLTDEERSMEASSYMSDMFAMIGTVFLWAFWPSFNSAELEGDAQHRAIINTYLSLTASCVVAYAFSSAFTPHHKFDMVHIQNSTLAGGVSIGTMANLMVQPFGALIIGSMAGVLSVIGYCFITPWVDNKLKVKDTCGVHNLHGMPALLAGAGGALFAFLASEDSYKMGLYQIFPAMASPDLKATDEYPLLEGGLGRTSAQQAGYQLAALGCTLGIAIVSGLFTGLFVSSPLTSGQSRNGAYKDDPCWLIHEHEHPTELPLKVSTVSEHVTDIHPPTIVTTPQI